MTMLWSLTLPMSTTHLQCRRRRSSKRALRRLRLRPRLLLALRAASRSVLWSTCKKLNPRSQSRIRPQWINPVQNRPTSTAPSSPDTTRRLLVPRRRTSTTRQLPWTRSQRPTVRPLPPRSSAEGYFNITRRTRDLCRSPTSILGCIGAGITTTTRHSPSGICCGCGESTTW